MARPLSEEKRNALLAVATDAVASTLKIAKDAGGAEGTLFVYFPTKDDLLNQLYLDLKADLFGFLAADYPADASIQQQIQYQWNRFVDWGASRPDKRKAIRQLSVSEKITEESHNAGEAMFYGFTAKRLRAQADFIQGLSDRGNPTDLFKRQVEFIRFSWKTYSEEAARVWGSALGAVAGTRPRKQRNNAIPSISKLPG